MKRVKKILKEGRKARQHNAEASACNGGSVNDNAERICWFCHADVSRLKNNKCAGCRKVTHPSVLIALGKNNLFCRRATVAEDAREQTGTDMETIVSPCRRRFGRRWRPRELNRKVPKGLNRKLPRGLNRKWNDCNMKLNCQNMHLL